MPGGDDLRRILSRIDGRGYKAYREIRGAFEFGPVVLHVDHVQGDPFAAPSKLRIRVAQAEARLPSSLFRTPVRRMAFADHLARRVDRAIGRPGPGRRGSGKSGLISVDAGGQQVLERTAVRLESSRRSPSRPWGPPHPFRSSVHDRSSRTPRDEPSGDLSARLASRSNGLAATEPVARLLSTPDAETGGPGSVGDGRVEIPGARLPGGRGW